MRKIFSFLMLGLCSLSLSAQQMVTGVNIVNYQAKTAESAPKMFVIPIVANLELVKDAPNAYSTSGVIKIPTDNSGNISQNYMVSIKEQLEQLKSKALFEFSEKAGADLILSPMYSITTEESRGLIVNVIIKVKGYPAKYSNFRGMTENDAKLVTTAAMIEEDMSKKVLNSQSVTNHQTIVKQ